MTRIEVIQMIGDLITEIDVARAGLMPDDPGGQRLDDLRLLLDDRQRKLSQAVFNESRQVFQDAAAKLYAVNDEIAGTIASVENIATTIANTERFLNAATGVVAYALTGEDGPEVP